MFCRSSKETHVGTANAIVRIADSTEEPLSDGALSAVGSKEVVENGRVEGADCALTKVIVVSFNLGAAIVVRVLYKDLDQVGIDAAEFAERLMSLVESIVLKRGDESVELLLLISLSALLNNYRSSEMLEKLLSENSHCLGIVFTGKVMIESLALVVYLFILRKVTHKLLPLGIIDFIQGADEAVVLVLGPLINTPAREG